MFQRKNLYRSAKYMGQALAAAGTYRGATYAQKALRNNKK